MKRKKKDALIALCNRIEDSEPVSNSTLQEEIRTIADADESFENIVFELGCSVLAKAYIKRKLWSI